MKTIVNQELNEYKKFAFNKNMVEVAIGLVLATAFHNATKAIADSILMPILNFALAETDGDWRKWKFQPIGGLNLEIGNLLGSLIDFLIVSFVLYVIYAKFYKPFVEKSIDNKVDIEYHI